MSSRLTEVDYVVTFEFSEQAPVTVRGTISASSVRTMAARAVDEAVAQRPGTRWTSLLVALDRGDQGGEVVP